MAGSALSGQEVRIRFVVEAPVAGVMHSLQARNGHPINWAVSTDDKDLTFDFTIRVAPGPRFLGEQVRSEGKIRRFVYIGVGKHAGDPASPWDRRMKIDIHDIPPALLERALGGKRLVATIPGTAADGTPSCATVRPRSWSVE